MTTSNALLGLWAETSIHAGAGSSVAGVDLPIQREAHNSWPCVFGSAVKGALRAKAEDKWGKDNDSVRLVFGSDSENDSTSGSAGALLVGDARLLLMPVRSLTSHFKWVTCPDLLKRVQRDAQRLNMDLAVQIPEVVNSSALQHTKPKADLFLEEYRFTAKQSDLEAVISHLSDLSGIGKAELAEQLVIVSNDMFAFLCRFATPVTAHIAIDNETKTVKKGALWYEETMPPESVFYCVLSASRARDMDKEIQSQWQSEAVLKSITQSLFGESPYLQLGGNETVGMGWCKINVKGA